MRNSDAAEMADREFLSVIVQHNWEFATDRSPKVSSAAPLTVVLNWTAAIHK